MRFEPPLQEELKGLARPFTSPQPRRLAHQLFRFGGEFGMRNPHARSAHPTGRLGDGQARLVPAAERLEPRPEEFAAADVFQLAVVPQPLLHLRQ